ncbi:MAG: ABC transporter permease [Planctomycetes bacterium]|nr:ABC transporter permease [Planctomycetota bacterium]
MATRAPHYPRSPGRGGLARSQRIPSAAVVHAIAGYGGHQDATDPAGRSFAEAEERRRVPVVVPGSDLAEALFPGQVAGGRSVRILGRHFDVIGVL